jgi:deoxyribonuclease V
MTERLLQFEVSPREAIELQKELREHVLLTPLSYEPQTIGGCDVSMNRFADHGYAGFVTLSLPGLSVIDHAVEKVAIPFPYVPGLLSFRELPMLLGAWEKLVKKPELIVVDGIGIAHPRRLGIASHLGLILGVPTIGCAKSVLVGTYNEPANETGAVSDLIDPKTGEVLGAALRTKPGVKPVFISPGHLITLSDSLRIMRQVIRKHRIPEPTRLAHTVVNEYRQSDMVR